MCSTLVDRLKELAGNMPEVLQSAVLHCLKKNEAVRVAESFMLECLKATIKVKLKEDVLLQVCDVAEQCFDTLTSASQFSSALKINRVGYHFFIDGLGLNNRGNTFPTEDLVKSTTKLLDQFCNFLSKTLSCNDLVDEEFLKEYTSIVDNLSRLTWNFAIVLSKSPANFQGYSVSIFMSSFRLRCLSLKNDLKSLMNYCLPVYQHYENDFAIASSFFCDVFCELLTSYVQYKKHLGKTWSPLGIMEFVMSWLDLSFKQYRGSIELYNNVIRCERNFFETLHADLGSSFEFCKSVWSILKKSIEFPNNNNNNTEQKLLTDDVQHWVTTLQAEMGSPVCNDILLKLANYMSKWFVLLSNILKDISCDSYENTLLIVPLVEWAMDYFESNVTKRSTTSVELPVLLFRGYAHCFYYIFKDCADKIPECVLHEHILFFQTHIQADIFTPEKKIYDVHSVLGSIAQMLAERSYLGVSALLDTLILIVQDYVRSKGLEESSTPNAPATVAKVYGRLALSYRHLGFHSRALEALAAIMPHVQGSALNELLKRWLQLKRFIYSSPSQTAMRKRSVVCQLKMMNCLLKESDECSLLDAELGYYRASGMGLEEEIFSVSGERIKLSSKHNFNRAMAIIDHCRVSRILKWKSKWNLESLCQEALETLEEEDVTSGCSLNKSIKDLYLSLGYFELYIQKSTQLKECIKASGVSRVKTTWVKAVPKGDEEPSTSCDIQASLRHVTLVSGTECLKPLEKSLSSLQQATTLEKWNFIKDSVEPKLLVNHCFVLAECFLLAQRLEQSVCCFVHLHQLGTSLNDQEVKCQAICRLVSILSRAGLPSQASLLAHSMQSNNPHLSLQCELATAEAHFYIGNFEKGFALLLSVLERLQTAQIPSVPRSLMKALEIEAHYLLVHFYMLSTASLSFLLNRDAQRGVLTGASEKVLALLHQPPIVIALNALKLCIKLYKTEQANQDTSTADWKVSAHKLCIERLLLEGGSLVGEVYAHQGEMQGTRHVLLEYLAVAQEHAAMLWSADLLISLAELDLLSHNPDDCKVKCQGLFYLLSKSHADPVTATVESLELPDVKTDAESPICSGQDTVVYRELDISPSDIVTGNHLFASPVSSQQPKTRVHKLHITKCLCERCRYTNVDVNLLWAMKLQAECFAYSGDLKSCVQELNVIRNECDKMIVKAEWKLQRLRDLAKQLAEPLNLKQRQFDFNGKRDSSIDNRLITLMFNLNLSLAECLIQLQNPQQALFYLDQSLTEMTKLDGLPGKFMPSLYAKLLFQKSLARLHILANDCGRTFTSLFHPVLANESKESISEISIMFNNFKIDKADVEIESPPPLSQNVKSRTKASILKAPIKKGKGIKKCDEPRLTSTSSCNNILPESKENVSPAKVKEVCANTKATVSHARHRTILGTSTRTENVDNIKNAVSEHTPKQTICKNKLTNRKELQKVNIVNLSSEVKDSENCVKTRALRNRDKPSVADKFEVLKSARATRQKRRDLKDNVEDDRETMRAGDDSSPEITRAGRRNAKLSRASQKKPELSVDSESEDMRQIDEHIHHQVTRDLYRSLSEDAIKDRIEGDCVFVDQHFPGDARAVFESVRSDLWQALDAVSLNPPSVLYSNISLLLAMIQNSLADKEAAEEQLKVSYHLSQSVGVSLRHQSLLYLHKRISARAEKTELGKKLSNLKSSDQARLDVLSFCPLQEDGISESMQKYLDLIPEEWTVVQVNGAKILQSLKSPKSVKTLDLMIARYTSHSPPAVAMISASDKQQCKGFLKEFEDIMETVVINGKEQQPKVWWTHRFNLDLRMENLCKSMESVWLGCWKCLFLAKPTNPAYAASLQNALETLLEKTSILSFHCRNKGMLRCLLDGVASSLLERQQVCSGLHYLFSLQPSQEKPILDIVQSLGLENFPATERNPLVLILDKMVHQLPWENMPFLRMHPVSRMPSLAFLLSQLTFHNQDNADSVYVRGVTGDKTFYLLNPSKDLVRTETFFKDKLALIPKWKGLTSEVPTKEQILSAVMDFDCYLYIGHGSGRVYLCKEYVQSYPCRAAVILMGCSSAKLKAVGCFEPSGLVFHYLMGGCPAVLGNLWDVTDKDIDQFTDVLIQKWLQGEEGTRMNLVLTEGRQVCRLKYLTGAAPVVYGLPLYKC